MVALVKSKVIIVVKLINSPKSKFKFMEQNWLKNYNLTIFKAVLTIRLSQQIIKLLADESIPIMLTYIADRFATTSWHNQESVLAICNAIDCPLLATSEILEVKNPSKDIQCLVSCELMVLFFRDNWNRQVLQRTYCNVLQNKVTL